MTNIGENIKKFRVFRKMTQVELGEAVGRSKNVVSNWERGDNAPDLDTLEKICKILKVTPNQMFGWEPNEEYERYRTYLMTFKGPENGLNTPFLGLSLFVLRIGNFTEKGAKISIWNTFCSTFVPQKKTGSI